MLSATKGCIVPPSFIRIREAMQQIQLCIIWYFNVKLGYSSFFYQFLIAKMSKMHHPIKFLAKLKQYNVRWRDTTHLIITSSAESL